MHDMTVAYLAAFYKNRFPKDEKQVEGSGALANPKDFLSISVKIFAPDI